MGMNIRFPLFYHIFNFNMKKNYLDENSIKQIFFTIISNDFSIFNLSLVVEERIYYLFFSNYFIFIMLNLQIIHIVDFERLIDFFLM